MCLFSANHSEVTSSQSYNTANEEQAMLKHFGARFCFLNRRLKSDFVCYTYSDLI